MRKVTASAVILTALTGCSQSGGIPSSQWSFEVPSEDKISRSQSELDRSEIGNSELDSESLADSDLSSDAQSFVEEASSRRTMGPAFEQPAVDIPAIAKASNSSQSDSSGLSALSAETYGLASGVSEARRSTRPDPVAQVRAYLRASGSPSALTSRVPYTSQVYLSSLPVPNQYYNTDITPAEATLSPTAAISVGDAPAEDVVDLNLTDAFTEVEAPVISMTSDLLPALSSAPGNFSAPSNFNESFQAVSETVETSVYAQTPVSSLPSPEPTLSLANSIEVEAETEAVNYSDGLPQLVPGTTAFTPSENISIGTAILNNIQQSSADTFTIASSTVASSTVMEPSPQVAEISPAIDSNAHQSAYSNATLDAIASDTVAYPLAVQVSSQAFTSAQPVPTLASLTETMPIREISPLVANYRADSSRVEPTSSSELSEDFSSPEILDSPLMDSFSEEPPLSTLYVPIAAPAPADVSSLLIQEGIEALEDGRSTSNFVDKIAKTDLFSSVLTSPAFVNDNVAGNSITDSNVPTTATDQTTRPSIAQRIPFANRERSPKTPIKAFADQRVKDAQKAAITFAAKQAMRRHERLNWL